MPAATGRKPVFQQRLAALTVGRSFETSITGEVITARRNAYRAAKAVGIRVSAEKFGDRLLITRIA